MWYDNGTIYFWSESEKVYLNADANNSFKFFSNLTDISGLAYIDTSKTWRFVPIQDFTRPWTDNDLYEKYGLTDKECIMVINKEN